MADASLLVGAAILLCIFALVLFLLNWFTGLLYTIELKTCKPPLNESVIAYKYYRGPYKECGADFSALVKLIPQSYKCIGIYYDNPNEVEKQHWHKLRYAVGTILSENGAAIDEEVKKRLMENGYKLHKLKPVSNAVYTTFPFKSFLSIYIAMMRVYPKFDKYIQKQNLNVNVCMEIYDDSTIHFLGPLSQEDQFYVDEYQ